MLNVDAGMTARRFCLLQPVAHSTRLIDQMIWVNFLCQLVDALARCGLYFTRELQIARDRA
jgi:hypothetical protein